MDKKSMDRAKAVKDDEFYTRYEDIEAELGHYWPHFKNKVVYCNCDDPRESNFFKYFAKNFEAMGLKKLITSCYKNQNPDLFSSNSMIKAVYLEYKGDTNKNGIPDLEEIGINNFKGDGDFRSTESVELLKQADIVVTNPPFSLFREYVKLLMDHQKKFLIVGNFNAVKYKQIWSHMVNNNIWLGVNKSGMKFSRRNEADRYLGFACWFTNLLNQNSKVLELSGAKYSHSEYPRYVNYDAIEVGQVKNIPVDYDGLMGVPITYLEKHDNRLFEIIGISKELARPMANYAREGTYEKGGPEFYLSNGDGTYRRKYTRVVIRRNNADIGTRQKISDEKMRQALFEQSGESLQCPGCDNVLPSLAYFNLDHDKPRSEGGSDDIMNRRLLCDPCNRRKSNKLTLTGLRAANKQKGDMAWQND